MYHLFKVLPLFLLVSIASHHSIDAVLRGSHEHLLSSRELGTPKKNKEDFEYPEGNPFHAIKAEINELSLAIGDLASLEALNDLEKKLDDSVENLNEKIDQLTNICCSNNGYNCVISDGNGMNSLELKGECWTKVKDILQAGYNGQCETNNGHLEFLNNEMTLWGSGNRHGNVVFPTSYEGAITKFDFAKTSTYAKWKAVNKGCSGSVYAYYQPRLLWINPSQVNDELYYCTNSPGMKDIATPGLHTTSHSFDGSVKIDFDTWYYTTMTVDTTDTGAYSATTCTTTYGCTEIAGNGDIPHW